MENSKTRRLKVFQAQFGFYDTVVAAASQAAALRAWGTRQNLFASGEARITTDESAVAVATAHPDTPLRRAVGSTEAFALEPSSLPKVPDSPKTPIKKRVQAPKSKAPSPPVDRSTLDAAERALNRVDERRKREEADFLREEQQLTARQTTAQHVYLEARKAAAAKVESARKAYRDAGGTD